MKIDDGARRGADASGSTSSFASAPWPRSPACSSTSTREWAGKIDRKAEIVENDRLRTEATFDERIYANDTAPFTF
jgi:hypothetical protein